MKKQQVKNLSLRKREISNLNASALEGGKGVRSIDSPCATQTEFPTCGVESIKNVCITQTEYPTCRNCI
ncbi:hypothetical protein [Kordia zhangzhouensis]|uniref:hypothetical protein n=1 Tax=Kordia zhangzhouensis TaxID=1620405 RepID=UPI000629B43E|nr:hypothetical protein [Kordia zhangzhouensis]